MEEVTNGILIREVETKNIMTKGYRGADAGECLSGIGS